MDGCRNTSKGGPDETRALRVLLVEDYPNAAATTAFLLQVYGHTVRVAPDGPAALEAARVEVPDVVLLDIGLPGMDGREVARRLTAQCTGKKPYLIALSGYGGAEEERRSAEAGIDVHLLKPVDPGELRLLLLQFGPRATADGARQRAGNVEWRGGAVQ